MPGILDVRWDNPALLAGNGVYTVVGVNVYRSDVSDRGPYHRVNDMPVSGSFWRDQTENVQITREPIYWNSSWMFKGDAPNDRRWVFKTQNPIAKQYSQGPYQTATAANAPSDVTVYIDGEVVPVDDVFGPTGEVRLINQSTFELGTEKNIRAAIPTEDSTVEITYWTNRNHVRSGLDATLYYRLATVVLDSTTPSGYRETELAYCPPITLMAVETLDYIWREAVRRNQWILQQGGERAKVFIRKQSGVRCYCGRDPRLDEYTKQPSQRCLTCYGTGFVGGYEGPYDIIMAPDDYERRISQASGGRRKEHTGEVWTGPTPLLTMRDFIVKQTNERYSVGAVRRPSNRGNLLQQHFNIAYFDEQDIRYKVPIDGTTGFAWPETRYSLPVVVQNRPVDGSLPPTPAADGGPVVLPDYPIATGTQIPMETEKSNIPDEREQRGRSPVWENQNY
jgi:hypothetical protein